MWIRRWQALIHETDTPGVWRLKTGGHLVRTRVTDPSTGRMVEIRKRLPQSTEREAAAYLVSERVRVRTGARSVQRPRQRFAAYATELLDRKVATREIKSARGREKWRFTLVHLIAGTLDVDGFGEMFVDAITASHALRWREGIARLMARGKYKPATASTWLGILKVISRAARRDFGLAVDFAEDLEFFDASEHVTYTEEEPNALTADEASQFLSAMRSEFPQHYAMTFLGFATGLRPSSLRPLRRTGPTPDVLWDAGVVLVRRSHTLTETVGTTKTGLRQRINVPPAVMSVLRWHAETQLLTPEQCESELLFPAEDGRPRSESALVKPFAIVSGLLGLRKRFTPRGMRRTFNDLARAAAMESLVTRSISGHLTERMKDHYSTVSPDEQRAGIGRVVLRLVRGGSDGDAGGDETAQSGTAQAR